MTGISHRLGGICAGLGAISLLQATDIKSQGIILGAAVIGSLLPDIDTAQSTISYKIPAVRAVVGVMQGLVRAMAGLLPRKQRDYIRSTIGHRGITHSLLFSLIFPALIIAVGYNLHTSHAIMAALGMMAGILSHILLDIFSNGSPLFLPFSKKRVTGARIKTGGIIERIFQAGLVVLTTIIAKYTFM